MDYKPLKICLYICITLLLLFGLTFVSQSKPSSELEDTEGFFIGDLHLKYPKTASFLMKQAGSKADFEAMDSIVGNIEVLIDEETLENSNKKQEVIPDFTKIDSSKIRRIVYPGSKKDFIAQLKTQLQSDHTRIIHYGDSQLEGDRISAYLRNRLQGIYGGSGSGFTPILQVYHTISSDLSVSDNWNRLAIFDPTQKKLESKKYGAYTSLSRFTPVFEKSLDSVSLDTFPLVKAHIDIKTPKRSYAKLKDYTKIGLHYGNSKTPTSIKVFNEGVLLKSGQLIADGNYHNYSINLPASPSHLRIELESQISPDFYGLTLDGSSGVQLDNVAMRGASGTTFATLNSANFDQMYQELKPKVLIFQYGGNSVPYIKDSLQVQNYAKYLKNHMQWVKRKAPGSQVIFIGPSDMTTKINGELQTYPLLPYLNEVLQTMCLENDMAYWSMFDAMGGKNSMAHWVDQKLAANDYTHFSPSGTKIISELFFLALYMDLNSQ